QLVRLGTRAEDQRGSTTDFIYMYYGDPSATDAQAPSAVWDSTFAAVWHLGSSLNDSTPHANNGTNNGSTLAPGQFGNARSFNGSSWIGVPDSPSLEVAPAATLEAWVKLTDPNFNDSTRVLDKKVAWDGPQGYDLEVQPLNNWITALGSGSTPAR